MSAAGFIPVVFFILLLLFFAGMLWNNLEKEQHRETEGTSLHPFHYSRR